MAKAISKTTASETQRLRNVIRRALPPVLQKLYEMALEGDTTAAKILIDRALPALAPVKEPVTFSGDTRKAMALEPVQSLPERRIAAQKTASKCSHSASMLRFFAGFSLALHPLIETLNRLLDIMDKVAAGQIEARDALVLFEVLEAAPREAKDAALAQGKGVSAETIMMVRREILGIQP